MSQSSAHCRVFVGDGTVGSGTLIANNDATALVLTCAHLFDASSSNIVLAFADGGRYGANLVERDPANDLAALVIRRPDVEPIAVNDAEPTGVLTACGYGASGEFRPVRGPISGAAQAIGAAFESLKIAAAVRPGDSGGAVLDSAGQLVGVVWGCRDGETYLTCGRPLRDFLDRVWRGRKGVDRRQPSIVGPDYSGRFAKIESDVADLRQNKQDRGDYLRVGDLNGYAKSTDVPAVDVIHQRIEEHFNERKRGLLAGMSFGKLIAGALGLSSPVALAVIVASALAGRRLKSRVSRPIPIAIDAPPLPQQAVPETHFVPFERDSFARAHQWASSQVARKYPGAAEVLTTLDSLIKQQLAGSK